MSQEKKFIVTTDKDTADKMISAGFKLMSQCGGCYTFLNQLPKNFSFDKVDQKQMAYTNILSM